MFESNQMLHKNVQFVTIRPKKRPGGPIFGELSADYSATRWLDHVFNN